MSKRVDLPGDEWAEIAERDELSVRDRRKIERLVASMRTLMNKAADSQEELVALQAQLPTDADAETSPELVERIRELARRTQFSPEELDQRNALQDLNIVIMLQAWSLKVTEKDATDELAAGSARPLPTLENVDEIPGPTYDALSAALSEPITTASFEPTKDDSPGNPTGSSDGSATPSTATPSSESSPPSSSDSASTAFDASSL